MDRDAKFIATSIVAITIGTILGLYIYHTRFAPSCFRCLSQMNQTIENSTKRLGNMAITPEYKVEIITSEFYDKQWNRAVGHTFYGNTEQEIVELIEAHKKTDSFFKASFEGEFKWKGGTIQLRNEESGLIQSEYI